MSGRCVAAIRRRDDDAFGGKTSRDRSTQAARSGHHSDASSFAHHRPPRRLDVASRIAASAAC
jgi:hypothetical protein